MASRNWESVLEAMDGIQIVNTLDRRWKSRRSRVWKE